LANFAIWPTLPFGQLCHLANFAIWPTLPFGQLCYFTNFAILLTLQSSQRCNFTNFAVWPTLPFHQLICHFTNFAVSPTLPFYQIYSFANFTIAILLHIICNNYSPDVLVWLCLYINFLYFSFPLCSLSRFSLSLCPQILQLLKIFFDTYSYFFTFLLSLLFKRIFPFMSLCFRQRRKAKLEFISLDWQVLKNFLKLLINITNVL